MTSTRAGNAVRVIGAVVAAALVLALTPLGSLALDGLAKSVIYRSTYADDDLLVVLAIGSDEGPPHRPGDPLTARADGIHLLVVDTRTSRMTVVDVPRDSAIGGTKVNAHLAFGGPERLQANLEAWSGLPIDFWALGSFYSLEQVATGLGGVEVEVLQPMHDRFSGSNLDPGLQRLDAGQALAFTRDRKSLPNGDIGRAHNQGRLIIAALEQMRRESGGDLQQVLGYVSLFERSVAHNIPPSEVLPLALMALRIEPANIEHVTISGPFGSIGGQSVIRPQPGDLFTRLSQGLVGPQGQ